MGTGRSSFKRVAVPLAGLLVLGAAGAQGLGAQSGPTDPVNAGGRDREEIGNMIFVHPDGMNSTPYWAARAYWRGPDSMLNWDRLPVAVPYRGHLLDGLTASSNGGATAHAFG